MGQRREGEGPEIVGEQTRLGAVLDRWPQAEAVVRGLSARFRALDHPVVRKAFTRAATLRQVAAAGGAQVATLLDGLRAAGVPVAPAAAAEPLPADAPAWADEARVTSRRDARADVAAGVHPLPRVMKELEALSPGDVYALTTPMIPAPLVDLARRKGLEAWSRRGPPEGPVRTYFRRRPAGAR